MQNHRSSATAVLINIEKNSKLPKSTTESYQRQILLALDIYQHRATVLFTAVSLKPDRKTARPQADRK